MTDAVGIGGEERGEGGMGSERGRTLVVSGSGGCISRAVASAPGEKRSEP